MSRTTHSRKNAAPPADPLENGLPCNLEIECWTLGAILRDGTGFEGLSALEPADFYVEKHRRIFDAINRVTEEGQPINYATVYAQLELQHWEANCDGIGGLTDLSTGVPELTPEVQQSWVRVLLNKSAARAAVVASQQLQNLVCNNLGPPCEAIVAHVETLERVLQRSSVASGRIDNLKPVFRGSGALEYLIEPELPAKSVVCLTGNAESGKTTLAFAWARDLYLRGHGVLILDRERNPLERVQERLRRLGITDEPGIRFRVWDCEQDDEAPQPNSREVLDWVKRKAAETGMPVLVIVDALVSFFLPEEDENSAGDMRRLFDRFRAVCKAGGTVLAIHHNNRQGQARGSIDFTNAADQTFSVVNYDREGQRKLDCITLEVSKSRYGLFDRIEYRYANGKMHRIEDRVEISRTVAERLTTILRGHPGIGTKPLEQLCADAKLGRQQCRDLLKLWYERGEIKILKGENNRSEYYLADAVPGPSDGDLDL
jgi:KaiC/GvpD/RAD55 family RecA-like ATPase